MTSGYVAILFMAILLLLILWKPFLAPTLDNADPLFALVINNTWFLSAPRKGDGSRPS